MTRSTWGVNVPETGRVECLRDKRRFLEYSEPASDHRVAIEKFMQQCENKDLRPCHLNCPVRSLCERR